MIKEKKYTHARFSIGTEFADGKLVVVGDAPDVLTKSGKRQAYMVECKICKNKSQVLRLNLVASRRKCCKFCMDKGIGNNHWKGCGNLSGSQFFISKNSAKVRNINFEITIEQAWAQYEKQNGLCALSGEPINFNPEKGWVKRNISASLDRIDSDGHYTIDNIQWISKDIQKIKMDMSEADLFKWCKLITDYQCGLVSYINTDIYQECFRHKNWTGYGHISGCLFSSYQRGARNRSLHFDITIEQLWNLIIEQRGLCKLSGFPIIFGKKSGKTSETTASLDRISSAAGYTIDNLQWTHKRVNLMKRDLDQTRFLELCKMISNFNKSV